jgi:pyruvate dehydrogenase E2 component (dihydrolipoamide acetyltransferase)
MLYTIELPKLSAQMEVGKVVKWYKQEGDRVEKGEILFEVETDKASVEVESDHAGYLRRILLQPGVEVPVNTPIAVLADTLEEDISPAVGGAPVQAAAPAATTGADPQPASPQTPSSAPSDEKRIKISPLARRIAGEHGLDIRHIEGTGPGGRITREDVEKALAPAAEKPARPAAAAPVATEAGPTAEDFEDIELTKMRRVIAERLSESKRTAPHFYVDVTADATALMQLKSDFEKKADQLGVKITFNDILIKLVAQTLKEFPMVNASFLGDRIRMYRAVNVGVAVGMEEGLIVPVLRDVDQKSLSQIGREVRDLAQRARNKKLLPEEYLGGTFTITNLGMFGVENFHAIINPPESGILAASSIIPKPVALEGEVEIRPCLKLSLSVDHRVVDGVLAARFLARVKELVEAPFLMFA